MNKKQKLCLWLGIATIVAMAIYPPWVCQDLRLPWTEGYGKVRPGPYTFIVNPPSGSKFIDLYRLGIQWITVAVITGGLIFTFKDKKPKDEQKQ